MSENYSDIAVSTRIRFARNLSDIPFMPRLSDEQAKTLCGRIVEEGSKLGLTPYIYPDKKSPSLYPLAEEHLVSREFTVAKNPRAILLSADRTVSIMVGEEDHLRIQVIKDGYTPDECLAEAENIESKIMSSLPVAFDEKIGYLTSCPTNLGTAIRVSVMLHLPALAESGFIDKISAAARNIGISVRGFYGEGSNPLGSLYQISNKVTLGVTEEEIINRIKEITEKLIDEERRLRKASFESNSEKLTDRVRRASAILKNAYMIDSNEAMLLLSDYRLGLSLGLLKGSYDTINKLYTKIQPYTVSEELTDNSEVMRDKKRAEVISNLL